MNGLVASLGTASDSSATNTVFGRAKKIQELWGTQTAQTLYDRITQAYDKGVELQTQLTNTETVLRSDISQVKSTVQASVGAIDAAVLELQDINTQMGPSVASLTTAAGNISTQVSNLEAAASQVTTGISSMESAALDVKTVASGLATSIVDSEKAVMSHMDTKSLDLKGELLSRTRELTQTVENKSMEVVSSSQKGQTLVMGAITGSMQEIKQQVSGAETGIIKRLGEPTSSTSIYADLLSLQTMVNGINDSVADLSAGLGGEVLAGTTVKIDTVLASVDGLKGVLDAVNLELEEVARDSSKAASFSTSASSSASAASASLQELKAILAGTQLGGRVADSIVGALSGQLSKIQKDIIDLSAKSSKEDLSADLKKILSKLSVSTENGDEPLIPEDIAEGKEIKVLQGDMEQVKALLDVINTLVRQQSNRPVIKTWFESGG